MVVAGGVLRVTPVPKPKSDQLIVVPSRRSLSRMMTFFRGRNSFEGQKCGEWIEDGEPRGSHEQLECLPSASGVRKP